MKMSTMLLMVCWVGVGAACGKASAQGMTSDGGAATASTALVWETKTLTYSDCMALPQGTPPGQGSSTAAKFSWSGLVTANVRSIQALSCDAAGASCNTVDNPVASFSDGALWMYCAPNGHTGETFRVTVAQGS